MNTSANSGGLINSLRPFSMLGASRGAFCGALSLMPVHRLGAAALGAAVRRAGLEPHEAERDGDTPETSG